MKLAEALQLRADINKKINQLRTRMISNAQIQEGGATAEDPYELKAELDSAVNELTRLISDINLTNSVTFVDGKTLTELIAEKDCLRIKAGIYREMINEASNTVYRARNTEIRINPSVDVKALQKEADEISKRIRLTDNKIQEMNWLTELKQN
ncbi:MAG: DIP1984 family protein [Clostridiales bacterium]|jgi:hypothetical protein|nr:DIP1984 family protein [Clostridiales bacterium]